MPSARVTIAVIAKAGLFRSVLTPSARSRVMVGIGVGRMGVQRTSVNIYATAERKLRPEPRDKSAALCARLIAWLHTTRIVRYGSVGMIFGPVVASSNHQLALDRE
jgi:hypothetical protein